MAYIVDPISRSLIDANLADALADRADVSRIPKRQSIKTSLDFCPRSQILQTPKPGVETIGLTEFEHG
jgi:hypothetical protein